MDAGAVPGLAWSSGPTLVICRVPWGSLKCSILASAAGERLHQARVSRNKGTRHLHFMDSTLCHTQRLALRFDGAKLFRADK
ncbi:MAG: hypothetical protein A3K23_01650 [Desulfobacca sp. RBG_16_58_9]|nr:MAG: hypothetical protein A3K23_01650 [Desulfobacca sp. RBG_16_58_9]